MKRTTSPLTPAGLTIVQLRADLHAHAQINRQLMRKKSSVWRCWADLDPADKKTPLAVYWTKAEQRANRPDLAPFRVTITRD
jgi:hypothetical protein